MSYSVLGMSCKSNTIARTSNHKFLPLRDSVYLKQHTYMMQYPGNSLSNTLTPPLSENNQPELIKSFYNTCKNC